MVPMAPWRYEVMRSPFHDGKTIILLIGTYGEGDDKRIQKGREKGCEEGNTVFHLDYHGGRGR